MIYQDYALTLYYGCSFNNNKINLSLCEYIPNGDLKSANRIEWENVVPSKVFGHSFSEWKYGHPKCINKKGEKYKGRKCAKKINKEFRIMLADMYNLYPTIGEVNGRRRNFLMSNNQGGKKENLAMSF